MPGADPVLDLPAPAATCPTAVAEVVAADRQASGRQGVVLFFTGLSGSGKSTLARGLVDLLLEQGTRTVTSLDGDVVRRTPVGRIDVLGRRSDHQHPPHRLGRRRDRPPRRRGRLQPDRAGRRDPQGGPGDGDRGGCGVLPRACRDAAGGVRAARPQGAVRPGAQRASCRSSPVSPSPYEPPRTPTSASTPPGARSPTRSADVARRAARCRRCSSSPTGPRASPTPDARFRLGSPIAEQQAATERHRARWRQSMPITG